MRLFSKPVWRVATCSLRRGLATMSRQWCLESRKQLVIHGGVHNYPEKVGGITGS